MRDISHLEKDELLIVGAMLDDPIGWSPGLAAARAAGIAPGTSYPALARLERTGWLESRWEEPPVDGRPRRRLYRLTGLGQRLGSVAALDRPRSRRPRLRRGFPAPKESLA